MSNQQENNIFFGFYTVLYGVTLLFVRLLEMIITPPPHDKKKKKIKSYVNELANHVCHGMKNSFYLVFDVGPHQTLSLYAHVLGKNNF